MRRRSRSPNSRRSSSNRSRSPNRRAQTINPKTGRRITVGGPTYQKLMMEAAQSRRQRGGCYNDRGRRYQWGGGCGCGGGPAPKTVKGYEGLMSS